MTTTFITGANKGLGHETARRLLALGHTVIVGARDEERGAEAAAALGARFVRIDVTDDASVTAAAADVAAHEGVLDVLINNAGVHGPHGDPADLTGADALGVFDVNVFGVVRTTTAFLPLLRRSADPVVINVSSGMGSLTITHDPARVESSVVAPLYTASKAALTMLTTQYAKGIKEFASTPSIPAIPRPTSTATAARSPSPRERTRSSCSRPRNPGQDRAGSSTVTGPSTGPERGPRNTADTAWFPGVLPAVTTEVSRHVPRVEHLSRTSRTDPEGTPWRIRPPPRSADEEP